MNIPQIKTEQQFAQIGLHITPSEQRIKQFNSRINVNYDPAQMAIAYKRPVIQTDWQPVWDDLGLKRPDRLIKEEVIEGRQKNLEVIGQIARNGDRAGDIASGEKNVFGNLAKERFFRINQVETTIVAIPRQGPEYTVKTEPPEINVRLGDVRVNPNDIKPRIDYKVSEIDVYLRQKPFIDISV